MDSVELEKRNAAETAVKNHYPANAKWVGIGSGTTIVFVVEAIKKLEIDTSLTKFVPTGYQSKQLILSAGLTAVEFDSLPEGVVLDVAFDGADEVDDNLNCIKGGGACLFQEKLVVLQAKEFICVADSRKLKPRLLTAWKAIPIEVAPIAVYRVLRELKKLGSIDPTIRTNTIAKAGPLKTDQGFFIIDAPFPPLRLPSEMIPLTDGTRPADAWDVETLSKTIKEIPGVLEVGIFSGVTGPQAQAAGGIGGQKPVAAYFGMPDGTVVEKKAVY